LSSQYETFVIYSALQGEMFDQIALKLLGAEKYANLLIGANPLYHKVIRFDGGEVLIVPAVPTNVVVGAFPWSTTYSLT
jgi:hypothetical protein